MKAYKVQKINTVCYKGNDYSLPSGTYKNQDSKVWVDIRDGSIDIYDMETGKQIAHHTISTEKGQYIKDPSHRREVHISQRQHEESILQYCKHDDLLILWLVKVKEARPRYYDDALRLLDREVIHYNQETLHRALELSIDSGMYNARDFIRLCARIGKYTPSKDDAGSYKDNLPAVAKEQPEKTDINHYKQYFS